ncbi:MAG: hypothetical protein OEV92_06055 [Nitrospinota bacterium]|nr:hypothetical protein [Nitrospinota bacterium]
MERRTGLSTAAAVKTKITIRRSVFFLLTVAIVGMLIEILLPGWANGNALLPMMWGFWLGAFLISPIFADWHIIRRLEAELEKASWPNTQPDVEVAK